MNLRTRVLVGALRRLPRPEPPGPGYLARVRQELPPVLARVLLGRVAAEVTMGDLAIPVGDQVLTPGSSSGSLVVRGDDPLHPPVGSRRWRSGNPGPPRHAPRGVLLGRDRTPLSLPRRPCDAHTWTTRNPRRNFQAQALVLRARVYRRRDSDTVGPLVINFHGGGFVSGNLTAADWLCGNVAGRAGVTVVSVDYRLAPEHPAPIPYEDCWAATTWLVGHAAELGVDPDQVSLMGESAGGNLAALVALTGRDRVRTDPDWPSFVRQILIYPATDLTLSSASVSELTDAPMLARRTLDWYGRRYLPQGTPTSISYDDPRVSPLYAPDHGDLAPALVLAAGQDPLRDDALRYADALLAAGTPVRTVIYPDAIHGFMSIPHFEPTAHEGLEEIVAELTAGDRADEPVLP